MDHQVLLDSLRKSLYKAHGDRYSHLIWNFLRGTSYSQVESRVGEWNVAQDFRSRFVGEIWYRLRDSTPPGDLSLFSRDLTDQIVGWVNATPPVTVPCNRKFYRKNARSSSEVASCPETV